MKMEQGGLDGTVLPSTSTNAGETNTDNVRYGKLVDRQIVEDSPFEIVTVLTEGSEKDTFLTIGTDQVTNLDTKERILEMIEEGNWTLFWNMAVRAALSVVRVEMDKHFDNNKND